MTYVIVGAILSIWFSVTGIVSVLKPRLLWYFTTVPIAFLGFIGFFVGMFDEQLGYEHYTVTYAPSMNGYAFYEFIFLKNWSYSIFVIACALLSYEVSKLTTRHYKARRPKRYVTTAEYMRDLPSLTMPHESGEFDIF